MRFSGSEKQFTWKLMADKKINMPGNHKGQYFNVSKELRIAWVSFSDMNLNKATYVSTLTEFINEPSLSPPSIHSICVVSSFLHFLSQMFLTSYDQILKGLQSQICVAKLHMEKVVSACRKILNWTFCIRDKIGRAEWEPAQYCFMWHQ